MPVDEARTSLEVEVVSAAGVVDTSSLLAYVVARPAGSEGPAVPADWGGNQAGGVRYVIEGLSAGRWIVELEGVGHLPPFDALRREVDVPGPPVRFTCLDEGVRMVPVALRVVDAPTGEPLPGSSVRTWVEGRGFYGLDTESDGRATVPRIRAGARVDVAVCSAGHRPAFLRDVVWPLEGGAGADGAVEIRLERGWGTVAEVVTASGPVVGVSIALDGREAAVTDERGLAILAGEAPPERVTLAQAGLRYGYGTVDAETGRPPAGTGAWWLVLVPAEDGAEDR